LPLWGTATAARGNEASKTPPKKSKKTKPQRYSEFLSRLFHEFLISSLQASEIPSLNPKFNIFNGPCPYGKVSSNALNLQVKTIKKARINYLFTIFEFCCDIL
jgi:hypothetical protein